LIDVGAIFDRISARYGLTQAELGKRINKSPQAMSQHRTNNTLDLRVLIEAFPDADLNWLFRGEASPEASEGVPLPVMIQRVIDAGYAVSKPEK
jgi:hypothetical protein